ncbi:TrbI/VirB10 family protein [Caulobacter sp. NIBR2454]|uniref:TrbI/VirB10 family protein n=1 Tax=Caulobacter sp. NIBR2454 TaxID=3015996 RepID=UPI0022B6A6F0|nr:TrbI/VirB10 family protein [Caulobacter sp. NIBR2454]
MTPPNDDLLNLNPTTLPRPVNRWVLPLGVGGAVLAGVAVFAGLSANRAEREQPATVAAAFEPAPPPIAPLVVNTPIEEEAYAPAPHMAGLSEQGPIEGAMNTMSDGTDARLASALDQRRRSPSVIVDLSAPAAGVSTAAPTNPALANPALATAGASDDKRDGDEAFARRLAAETTATARSSRLERPHLTAPQGTIVPAVLETALNSDLPGFVRAVVTRDVRAFDGETVVIPRGAKLVGQYRNGVAAGQSRAFVVWTRLLRPDGVTIDLASPAADALGRGGLQGKTDQHFFQRFGAAILLSVISGATTRNGGDTVVIGSAQDASRIAEIALQKQIDIPPTIKVAQGAPIRVFVARDLVFESAAR